MGGIRDPLLEAGGPVSHWIRPETLVDLMIEGRNVNALVDSGSQVNMIMPTFVQQYGFPVLPLEDLVDHPLNLIELGRKCMSPLSFIILCMQVWEITGYDEDIMFLMVPDESEFSWRVPLVIGTCTIGQIIKVIQESEIDHLSMPWATARMVQLLSCQKITAALTPGSVEAQSEGASGGPQEVDMDELVTVRECPFRTIPDLDQGQIKPLLGDTAHIMITPLRAEGQKVNCGKPDHFLQDSMSSMCIHALRTAVVRCPSWSGTFLTVTSSSRRGCQWCESCQHYRCWLRSCHQRWKLL